MAKVRNALAGWIDLMLEKLARALISREQQVDIAIAEKETKINNLINSQKTMKTTRKNFEDMVSENKERIEAKEKIIPSTIKKDESLAKIHIKAKLELEMQNQNLQKQIDLMVEKEKENAKRIEKLKALFEIAKQKAEYLKVYWKNAKAYSEAVDVDYNAKLDLDNVLSEMKQEITEMDNKAEAVAEMEQEGTISNEGAENLVDDAQVEAELEKYK